MNRFIICNVPGCLYVLSPTRKERSYNDQNFTFASHSKKNSESCRSNQFSATAMTSTSDENWRPFNCFFQSGRSKDLSAPLYIHFILLRMLSWFRNSNLHCKILMQAPSINLQLSTQTQPSHYQNVFTMQPSDAKFS